MLSRPRLSLAVALLVAPALGGCGSNEVLVYEFDFARGSEGWVAGFADYPAADESIYELEANYRPLEAPLDTDRSALYIAGTNRSDDLFMYYTGPVAVDPDTEYRVTFEVELATEVPHGCFGVGGAPGEGVTVKAGASVIEPTATLAPDGHLRMNVDKGNQSGDGADALALGDVANSRPCEQGPGWELKYLAGGAVDLRSDASGRIWLLFGSDSGFEARTRLYFTRFGARFEPI